MEIINLEDYTNNFQTMTSKDNHNVKNHIINILRKCSFSNLNKAREKFMIIVFIQILSIKGKINFMQLARYSPYCEQTHRNQFEQEFDFLTFNEQLIEGLVGEKRIIAFDPSYIYKSGKQTFGGGKFWSGSDKASKWGLEICGFAVIDVEQKTAFHLKAFQTPGVDNRNKDEFNLQSHYGSLISDNAEAFKRISLYMAADAYFSKKLFVEKVLDANMHLVSRLRDDSVLMYNYVGKPTGKKGRPKKFNGRINAKNLDENYFCKEICCEELTIYSAIAYSKAFKRNIKLAVAVFFKDGKEIARKLYFSTDLMQEGNQIVSYYRCRFQIEFLYRDAKQHTGLNDCQARSQNKLDFHFNASLTTVNLAKYDWLSNKSNNEKIFSMANYKTFYNNVLMLDRFICMFAINPNTTKNKLIINELLELGKIAA